MIHSFLMVGQSNMAGRGFLKDVPPICNERIKMLRNGRWQIMTEPINFDRPLAILLQLQVYRPIQTVFI